jgi:hypothetical protein
MDCDRRLCHRFDSHRYSIAVFLEFDALLSALEAIACVRPVQERAKFFEKD